MKQANSEDLDRNKYKYFKICHRDDKVGNQCALTSIRSIGDKSKHWEILELELYLVQVLFILAMISLTSLDKTAVSY